MHEDPPSNPLAIEAPLTPLQLPARASRVEVNVNQGGLVFPPPRGLPGVAAPQVGEVHSPRTYQMDRYKAGPTPTATVMVQDAT